MKEKEKEDNNNVEEKNIILNKKRKPDNSIKELKTKKKKMFILFKPLNDLNAKQKNLDKNANDNLINNLNFINTNNITKNINNITTLKNELNFHEKINDSINNDKNKNEIIYNNKKINNNLKNNINTLKNENKIESPPKLNQKQKEYGNYICNIENQIGSGSFGEVLYGKHKYKYFEVAVKIINAETSSDTIKKEIHITKKFQNEAGFPSIFDTFICDKKNIIIESLLGPSLDKLFKYCGRIFPLKTVCLIGKEMVKRLETMHGKGILHRDLKPNNLTWGNYNSSYNNISNTNYQNNNYELDINTIYLIDFGLSCSYYEHELSTRHYKLKDNLNFIGTLRYASLNSHKGIRQGRRDDLESMLYILIYFLKGKLPWQDIKAKQKEERHKIIFQIKSNITIDSLCKDIPEEFANLLKYVKSLEFDEKPSYYKFYAYFHNLISKLNNDHIEENIFNFIWEKMLVDNMNKYNENNDEYIIQEAEKLIFRGYPINLRNFTNYIIYNNKNRK